MRDGRFCRCATVIFGHAPAMIEALRTVIKPIKRMHDPLEVMLAFLRWYPAYPLTLRHIEEMMQVRGVCVEVEDWRDHRRLR